MFRNFKSAVVATGLVLATVNAAMAANEYHLRCESEGGTTMRASINPVAGHDRGLDMCGYIMYTSVNTVDHIRYCFGQGEAVIVYYHNDYENRLCTGVP